MKNLRFDRIEKEHDNIYNQERGTEKIGATKYEGFLKCKLIHSKGISLIIPDLIYLTENDQDIEWIQFYSFLPCNLTKFSEEQIFGSFYVDIAFGQTLRLTIKSDWHQFNLSDNSNIYKCRIEGPNNLSDYTTGTGQIIDQKPYVNLYHHTKPEYKELILDSGHLKCSAWNYQGTKELNNFSYCYFTSLPELNKPNDLKMIAMSSDGKIQLMTDINKEIVEIEVYRESTENRTATLEMLIDSTIIENNHLWMHETEKGQVFYEIFSPFIYRIGANKNTNINFENNKIEDQPNLKNLKYLVIGNALSKEGISAPYNEEETDMIFKIEPFENNGSHILNFWFENANTDQYSRKDIEELDFE